MYSSSLFQRQPNIQPTLTVGHYITRREMVNWNRLNQEHMNELLDQVTDLLQIPSITIIYAIPHPTIHTSQCCKCTNLWSLILSFFLKLPKFCMLEFLSSKGKEYFNITHCWQCWIDILSKRTGSLPRTCGSLGVEERMWHRIFPCLHWYHVTPQWPPWISSCLGQISL